MRGGYQIVDFKKYAFTSGTEATVAGTYDAVKSEYGKAILVSGLKVGTTAYDDMYIPFVPSSTSFVGTIALSGVTLTITVANDDGVTVVAAS